MIMELKLNQIADFCGGKLFGDGSIAVKGFFTDSRKAAADEMFIPIKGENVDAHKFIPNVVDAGCMTTFSQIPLDNIEGLNYVLVDNCISAFQKAAEMYRETLKIPVIGITGSVGKTTTKEIVSLALESRLRVLKTAGNANSQIGLPMTVFRIDKEHQAAVLEMGMSMPGEMERIAKVAKPSIAIITNIGVSHIEFHGSREKIMEQKLHIADYLDESGVLIVNGDDDLLSGLKGKINCRVLTFGVSDDCDYRAADIVESPEVTCFTAVHADKQTQVKLPVAGIHNVRNALAALAAAEQVGISMQSAAAALSAYNPPEMRQQIKNFAGVTVIDDTYNASPDSMISSLQLLGGNKGTRKIAVLADMLELGAYSEKGHTDVGIAAKSSGIDYLIAIGEEAANIRKGFGDDPHSAHFDNNSQAIELLDKMIAVGDTVLVKGSRGMKTEEIVRFIEKKFSAK